MYPADLEEGGDSGIVAAQSAMDSSPATSGGTTAARMKKRGTIASQNHLQLPGAGLADNSLARDNSSLCHMAAEVPESATTKCCFWCLPLDTKIAVFIAASVGLGVNLVGVLFYTIQGQFGYALPSLFSCLLYSSALFAQYRQRASLFLPFLLINAIFMFLWACLCVYLLTLLILLPDWCVQLVTEYFEWDEMDQIFGGSPTGVDRIRRKVRLFLAVSLLLTLIYLFMECWLWWLVYRGFKSAKDWHAEEWLQNLNKNIRSISIY